VASHTQDDFVSFHAFANYTHNYWVRSYPSCESTEAREIDVGRRPAIRYDITYESDGCRMGMVQIFCQIATRYNLVVVQGFRSLYSSQKDQWSDLAKGLSEMPH
jgi:hypothetical protein